MSSQERARILSIDVEDIRFRFPALGDGSDAINPHTDYSNPYVTVSSDRGAGVGIGFSLGRGNEQICSAVVELAPLLIGKTLEEVLFDFGTFKWTLSNPIQSRWIAPGAGAYYMAGGAIMNAVFDLWAKLEGKPLWRALIDLEPEQIVRMIDFRYVSHVLTPFEALEILRNGVPRKESLVSELLNDGLPCYFTTWIGTGKEKLLSQIRGVRADRGITSFKLKVGSELARDRERLEAIRNEFDPDDITLFVDANQVWSAPEAVQWMRSLSEFQITWIEEPTAPDSIDGHRLIRDQLSDLGIEVVSGENCPNPQVATQFIAGGAVDRFQIDACRMMGVADCLLVYLVAAKHGIPVCPHAGGSGLDELVPHLAAWNQVSCAQSFDRVGVEQVGFCSHFFAQPSEVVGGRITVPRLPGYLVGLTDDAKSHYRFPDGPAWRTE